MIPELGNFALSIGLAFAICLSFIPLIGVYQKNDRLIHYAWPLSYGLFFFLFISIILLGHSFVVDNFSVAYVAQHSNSQLPTFFKVAAIWGGHEGSLLLWIVILSAWIALVAGFSRQIEPTFIARVLSVMGMIAVGFIAFTLLTSNPFERFLPNFPIEGRDLNPLLQDIGLIIHPPMLYMGYVGFSVAFAFAVAALMSGQIDAAWARWSRPWTLAAWGFLSIGIALGSWWAYYELGWGGWWFWDPVENASFMPWLVGTALVHALAVNEKRGTFKNWTILLAIFTFSLSLLGTFLVRSGVVTSVHSFASDPTRGLFILVLLAIAMLASLGLFAFKASDLKTTTRFDLASRETAVLAGNVILVVSTLSVMLGTLAPMILSALDLGRISVGPPYFNLVFNSLMIPLIVLMGIGPFIRWKKAKRGELKAYLPTSILLSVIAALGTSFYMGGELNTKVVLGMSLAFWVIFTGMNQIISKVKTNQIHNESLSYWGMHVAHVGISLTIIGITLVSNYEQQKDVRMSVGSTSDIAGYTFKFHGIKPVEGPNYIADQGQIEVFNEAGKSLFLLTPERRTYQVQTMGMTEAGINPGFTRDIYVALGDPLSNGDWAIRLHYKPFVRFIWLGAIFMAFGGGLSILDKRYRRKKIAASEASALNKTSSMA